MKETLQKHQKIIDFLMKTYNYLFFVYLVYIKKHF